jgi:HK97 gp10 family phage protein
MAKQIKGLDSLLSKLSMMGGNVQNALTRAMKTTIQATEGDAMTNSKYGSVKPTIHSEIKEIPGGVEARVFCNHPAAAYIEFGTGPKGQADHAGISPNVPVTYHPTSWAYESEEYGWVTTSGQPAKPFMYPAAKQNEPVFEGETRKELLLELRKAGG